MGKQATFQRGVCRRYVTLARRNDQAGSYCGCFRLRLGFGLCLLAALALNSAPLRHIGVVLRKGRREGMATGAIGNEVEVFRLGRIEYRLNRRPSRIGDRCWRQSLDFIRIVGRLLLQLTLENTPAERTLAADNPVNDGRIGLQRDTLFKPIYKDTCDA